MLLVMKAISTISPHRLSLIPSRNGAHMIPLHYTRCRTFYKNVIVMLMTNGQPFYAEGGGIQQIGYRMGSKPNSMKIEYSVLFRSSLPGSADTNCIG